LRKNDVIEGQLEKKDYTIEGQLEERLCHTAENYVIRLLF
jgi:hypothetical protein